MPKAKQATVKPLPDAERRRLYDEEARYVRGIAGAFARKRGLRNHLDDLKNVALLALWECSADYDPSRGPFRSRHYPRVLGAMYDWCRAQIPLGYRGPAYRGTTYPDTEAIDALQPADLEPLLARSDPPPAFEAREAFAALIRDLPPRENLALSLYYADGLTVRACAALIGGHETRFWQLLAAGRERVRSRFAPEDAA